MPYRIRQIAPESKYCHQLSLDALHRFFVLERLLAIVEEEPACAKRERRLNQVCTIFILIAQALLPSKNLREVMASLLHPLRMLWPAESSEPVPVGSALSYRRAQLGIRPLRKLFEQVCQPLASTPEQMPWAFAFGRRVMALDSTLEAVPDTPLNAVTFGYLSNGKGRCAYPLVRGIYLIECGPMPSLMPSSGPVPPTNNAAHVCCCPKWDPACC